MKIKDVRVLPLRRVVDPYANERGADAGPMHTLVEVITDEGLVGLGSANTTEAFAKASVEFLRPLLLGDSAIDPARVTEKLLRSTIESFGSALTHAISGIDIALWDILGKAAGQPIGRLLGGRCRDRVKAYASILMAGPEEMPRRIEAALARGFKAVKIGWGPFGLHGSRADEAIIHTAREATGPDVELMVDAGGSGAHWAHGIKWALETSCMLEDYGVTWFEEPLRPDDVEGHATLTEHARVPIASGEALLGRQSFRSWIERRAVDLVQPDVTRVGGITEAFRIATACLDRGIDFAPHGWNTAVGLAADLQLVSALPAAQWVEFMTPAPLIDDLVATPFELDGEGYLRIPDRPGLGVVWNREGVSDLTDAALTPSAG